MNCERMTTLRRCKHCPNEESNCERHCSICGGTLITVVYSILDGGRITPTFDEERFRENEILIAPWKDRFYEFKKREPELLPLLVSHDDNIPF